MNSNRLYIPTTGFKIEFNIITANPIGIYIQRSSSTYYYTLAYSTSGLNNIRLEYLNNEIKYYFNNNLTKTTEAEFDTNEYVGFFITDWQNDMDITITHLKIDKIQ